MDKNLITCFKALEHAAQLAQGGDFQLASTLASAASAAARSAIDLPHPTAQSPELRLADGAHALADGFTKLLLREQRAVVRALEDTSRASAESVHREVAERIVGRPDSIDEGPR